MVDGMDGLGYTNGERWTVVVFLFTLLGESEGLTVAYFRV